MADTQTPFNANSSAFTRRMAQGHKMRLGHTLTGYYLTDSEGISRLHRTCCTPAH